MTSKGMTRLVGKGVMRMLGKGVTRTVGKGVARRKGKGVGESRVCASPTEVSTALLHVLLKQLSSIAQMVELALLLPLRIVVLQIPTMLGDYHGQGQCLGYS